jgi:hypothetical protein
MKNEWATNSIMSLGAARAASAQGLPTFRLKAKLGSVVAVKCLIYLIGAPRLNEVVLGD